MKKKILSTIFVSILLVSCNSNTIYQKLDKNFNSNQWKSAEIKTHDFVLEENITKGRILLKFAHVYDYQFDSVPIIVEIKYPNSKIETQTINLQLKDKNGKEIGDCSGDICDLNFPILENSILQKGKYTIKLSNNFKNGYLPNVLALGIEVEKMK